MSTSVKEKLYDYALRIGRHTNYRNAGTVEFLVEGDDIYFIEVNPRIQVEHTITEEITGIDIVRTQILIAMNYPFRHPQIYIHSQMDIRCNGYAIQCRITTEDPANGFKPDYGTLVAYRSAAGFGIRLDAGSAYAGAKISPFFDSMLVKCTARGRTLKGAAQRLARALSEFRIRGVKSNIGFLMNLLDHPTFQEGQCTVNFIKENPSIMKMPRYKDRGTKLLKYLGDVIVNGNSDVKYVNENAVFEEPKIPAYDPYSDRPRGSRTLYKELGRERFMEHIKNTKAIQYTDTTFRDGHQSLLATRVRTQDMMRIAEAYSRQCNDVFSAEVWGGATFDVCMRFLKENPWDRLAMFREAMPNILLQMLLRGSNAVGYAAYPDNLVQKFIVEAAETGIDVFRIFDSLNWIEAMRVSIKTVAEETDSIAQACICYTGDISDPNKTKYGLQYYLDLAKNLEDAGAHMLCIKDMAGLLKPRAAEILVKELKKSLDIPIHLHTHDTSSIQSTTYLKAIEAGVDVVDLALSSMSGLTSQPNFNSVVAYMKGHERENRMNTDALNAHSNYWESVRKYYYPFETELKAGTAEVYEHEIPGGQYSNLRPQARGLGLEDKFETIKQNYALANQLFGDLVKVTPSSKVVGDMAMFMTANGYSKEDILENGKAISFPDSVKALFRGDLGQPFGGFPKDLSKLVLKDEKPYTERPNAHLAPIDFNEEFKQFQMEFDYCDMRDFLSFKLYPKVFRDFYNHYQSYGDVWTLPTPSFFYGLKPNEEILVNIGEGKNLLIRFLNMSEPNEEGMRSVLFSLNGQTRSVDILDKTLAVEKKENRKAAAENEIGAPLQGSLSKILVKEGDKVKVNQPLFVIEAMKMESTITSPVKGKVVKIHLKEKTMLDQDDLVIELG